MIFTRQYACTNQNKFRILSWHWLKNVVLDLFCLFCNLHFFPIYMYLKSMTIIWNRFWPCIQLYTKCISMWLWLNTYNWVDCSFSLSGQDYSLLWAILVNIYGHIIYRIDVFMIHGMMQNYKLYWRLNLPRAVDKIWFCYKLWTWKHYLRSTLHSTNIFSLHCGLI